MEDSPDDEFIVRELLLRSGIPVAIVAVNDGDKAIDYLKRAREFADPVKCPMPRAISVDLKMRRVGGLEVLRWIKTQAHLRNVLRVVLTHCHEVKDVNLAYELGAHSFLTKPLTRAELTNLMLHFRSHFQGCGQIFPAAIGPMPNRVQP